MLKYIISFCLINLSINMTIAKETDVPTVAVLVYDGVYLLDYVGPLEVFFDTYSENGEHLFNVFTVSPSKTFQSHVGNKTESDFLLTDCPKADILIIPGGNLNLLKDNAKLKEFIIDYSEKSKTILSVCTGAFILADAGLLKNQKVTTWHGVQKKLQQIEPSCEVLSNVRYTDNGKIITTAGISAGIDGALHVVKKYYGSKVAKATAEYMDYDYWKE